MRASPIPLLLFLLGLFSSTLNSCQATAATDDIILQDIVAKEQAWAKRALERRGQAIAGSAYLDELLNMDHHLAEYKKKQDETSTMETTQHQASLENNSKKILRSRTIVQSASSGSNLRIQR